MKYVYSYKKKYCKGFLNNTIFIKCIKHHTIYPKRVGKINNIK